MPARRPASLALALLSLAGCRAPEPLPECSRVATVEAFRAALAADDRAAARALLAPDPRVWYDAREGPGSPWTPGGGGRWSAWDEHFRGETEPVTAWVDEGDRVWADMRETNDYFRLTERAAGTWRATYFLDAEGRIAGFLVSAVPGVEAPRGRREEFEAWAFATHPEEAEYLMPGGAIDPTGDRPPRMRALLNAWRASVGLAPILAE